MTGYSPLEAQLYEKRLNEQAMQPGERLVEQVSPLEKHRNEQAIHFGKQRERVMRLENRGGLTVPEFQPELMSPLVQSTVWATQSRGQEYQAPPQRGNMASTSHPLLQA